ncbi:MAG: polysaccharide lyase family 7 protein [Deltaproteobacteria bacterium]|nr:polysaccharide lyase family 7 protein [Deltaproteobacteria bacterium]
MTNHFAGSVMRLSRSIALLLPAALPLAAAAGFAGCVEEPDAEGSVDSRTAQSCPPEVPLCRRVLLPFVGHPAAPRVPGDLLDLRAWKLTLPVGEPEAPREVKQPELRAFSLSPYFELDAGGHAVRFRAPVGGVTTRGSVYPRSELREMTPDGLGRAAWSSTSGRHTLVLRQAITHLPNATPAVVAGQIHDADRDLLAIRLEGERLFVDLWGADDVVLDAHYQLATPFAVRLEVYEGRLRLFYDDAPTPALDRPFVASGCYFKAGCYPQSNVAGGESPDAYGETKLFALQVSHTE